MRRRYCVLALALAGLAVTGIVGFAWLWPGVPQPGVTRASCWRIPVGMGRLAVAETLGGPPGVYSNEPGASECAGFKILSMKNGVADEEVCFWYGDEGVASIVFGPDDRVVRRHWSPRTESFLDRLLNWLIQ